MTWNIFIFKWIFFFNFIQITFSSGETIFHLSDLNTNFNTTIYSLPNDFHVYLNLSSFFLELNSPLTILHNLIIENAGVNNTILIKNEVLIKNNSSFSLINLQINFEEKSSKKFFFQIDSNCAFFLEVFFYKCFSFYLILGNKPFIKQYFCPNSNSS